MYKSFPPKPSRDGGEKSSLDKAIQSGTQKLYVSFRWCTWQLRRRILPPRDCDRVQCDEVLVETSCGADVSTSDPGQVEPENK